MAKPKNRRKIIVFTLIVLVLGGLAAAAILRKRDVVVTVQTEKTIRRNLTEIVVANGKVQPVLQVKISAEVSGEITDLPVKEGQAVKKGDLLVKIKPDLYVAALNQAEAGYKSSLAGQAVAEATLRKEAAEYKRNQDLFHSKLVSDSAFDEVQAAFDMAKAQLQSAGDQVDVAKAMVDSAKESLDKTTISSPLNGTISRLNSRLGERVLGTIQNVGTEIMTISDLNEMETRVDIGENDVVRILPGQRAKLEVDAFKDKKFTGTVTEIANSAKDTSQYSGGSSQEATKFEVRIRILEKEAFRPGMSVTAEIETCYRTNALTVPFASVTTRPPKEKKKHEDGKGLVAKASSGTNQLSAELATNSPPTAAATNSPTATTNSVAGGDKKATDAPKQIDVVFVLNGDHADMVPVKRGISDDNYWEIVDGLKEGQEVVSGNFKAISRDLEDGIHVRKGPASGSKEKGTENRKGD